MIPHACPSGGLKRDLPSNGLGKGEADVVIRPEAILIGDPGKGLRNESIPGMIVKSTYMGASNEYTVRTELGELFVIAPDRLNRILSGEAVVVSFADDGIIVVCP